MFINLKKNNNIFSFRTIVTSPALLFPFVDLFSALCGNGMMESMLEPHLRETNASTIEVGASFLGFGCSYSIGSMLFGLVSRLALHY